MVNAFPDFSGVCIPAIETDAKLVYVLIKPPTNIALPLSSFCPVYVMSPVKLIPVLITSISPTIFTPYLLAVIPPEILTPIVSSTYYYAVISPTISIPTELKPLMAGISPPFIYILVL